MVYGSSHMLVVPVKVSPSWFIYYTLLSHLLVIPVGSPVAINHPESLVVRLKDEQEPVRGGVLRVRLEQLGEGGEEATTVGHVFNDLEKGRRKEGCINLY